MINTQPSVAGHGDTEKEGRQEADPSTEGREGACTAALHGGNDQNRSGGGSLFMLKSVSTTPLLFQCYYLKVIKK